MMDFTQRNLRRKVDGDGSDSMDRNRGVAEHPERSHATWVAVAIGGSAVIGAGTSIYGANQASKAAAAQAGNQRNFGGELGTIGGLIPGFNQAGFQNQQLYNGALTNLNLQNFQNAQRGNFDVGAFSAQTPGFEQFMQDAQANGQMQGWTPQQMAAAYTGKSANDPSLNQFFSGGIGQASRDAFNSANGQLAGYTNQLGDTLSQMNKQTAPSYAPSGYFASGSGNTQLGPASQSQGISAQSYGDIPANYSGGGYQNIAGPMQARNVSAMAVSGPNGYDRVNPQTGFNSVNAQSSDFGLMTAANRLASSGTSPLQNQLTQQASSELALGGALSDEDRRNATQAAREGWAARGLINSNGAVAEEALNRQALSDQRLAQRQQFAQGVEATNFGQGQQGFSNALGLSGAAQNYAGLNLQGQQANLGAQLQGNQLGLQGQIANQGARQANNALGQQGQIANQNAFLQAQQANQGADLTLNNQRYQVGAANQAAGLQNNQLGLGYAQLNNSAFQDAQARLQQGSQFNANLGVQNNQFNAAQQNAFAQFGANLGQANNQFNANATNQAAQFNSGASNTANQYNASMQQQAANDAWSRSMGYGNFLAGQAINPFTAYSQVQGQAPDYTNALLGYGSDLFNTNSNAQSAANIAAGNRAGALTGAGLGLVGTGLGALGNYAGSSAGSNNYGRSTGIGGYIDPSTGNWVSG